MKRFLAVMPFVLVVGCATDSNQSTQSGESPHIDTGAFVGEVSGPRNRARLHTELAGLYYGRRNMGVALDELRIAVKADPSYASAYSMFGLVYMELRERALAEENFQRALGLSPNDPDINHNYGWYLCQTEREADSVQYFLRAIRNPLYQKPWRSYSAAGLCLLRIDKVEDAEALFERALKLNPREPRANLQMGEIRYRQGAYDEAQRWVRNFGQVSPPTAESLWLSVRIERKRGQNLNEASLASQLRRRFPGSPENQKLQRGEYD
jgi:type IV pilus assembly protein PilF